MSGHHLDPVTPELRDFSRGFELRVDLGGEPCDLFAFCTRFKPDRDRRTLGIGQFSEFWIKRNCVGGIDDVRQAYPFIVLFESFEDLFIVSALELCPKAAVIQKRWRDRPAVE